MRQADTAGGPADGNAVGGVVVDADGVAAVHDVAGEQMHASGTAAAEGQVVQVGEEPYGAGAAWSSVHPEGSARDVAADAAAAAEEEEEDDVVVAGVVAAAVAAGVAEGSAVVEPVDVGFESAVE